MFFDYAKTCFHNHLNLVFDLHFLFLIAFIVIKSKPLVPRELIVTEDAYGRPC